MKGRFVKTRSLVICLIAIYLALQLILLQMSDTGTNLPLLGLQQLRKEREQSEKPITFSIDLDEEIRKNLKYVRSITDTKRKLLFVHIPKAAGSTMEEVGGKQANLAWGSCLFNHKPKRRGGVCSYPPGQFEWPTKIGYWHLPTQVFPLMGTNPYKGADLFAVVRDPYDRLLSEFYYICRKKVSKNWNAVECNSSRLHEPDYMNEWLQKKLRRTPTNQLSSEDYLDHNGHFTPQYDFIVASGEIRMMDYVLRMDQLQSEFPSLMNAYGITAVLPPDKLNAARNDTRDLEARHFDATTNALIHEKYQHDFDLFETKGNRA